jgi:FlaA1/EpsC-like NDP-sugar epimerase
MFSFIINYYYMHYDTTPNVRDMFRFEPSNLFLLVALARTVCKVDFQMFYDAVVRFVRLRTIFFSFLCVLTKTTTTTTLAFTHFHKQICNRSIMMLYIHMQTVLRVNTASELLDFRGGC